MPGACAFELPFWFLFDKDVYILRLNKTLGRRRSGPVRIVIIGRSLEEGINMAHRPASSNQHLIRGGAPNWTWKFEDPIGLSVRTIRRRLWERHQTPVTPAFTSECQSPSESLEGKIISLHNYRICSYTDSESCKESVRALCRNFCTVYIGMFDLSLKISLRVNDIEIRRPFSFTSLSYGQFPSFILCARKSVWRLVRALFCMIQLYASLPLILWLGCVAERLLSPTCKLTW